MKRKKGFLAIIIVIAIVTAITLSTLAIEPRAGELIIRKVVDDDGSTVDIVDWLDSHDEDVEDVLSSIEFALYKSDEDGTEGEDLEITGTIGLNSMITFSAQIEPGWYLVYETLSGRAAEIFAPDASQLVFFNGTAATINSNFFDCDAFYTIVNGYGSGYVLGYPGLNNTGDIFPIAVRNTITGRSYPSFCAHAGSINFAGESGLSCSGYMTATPGDLFETEGVEYNEFLKAYNYIEANIGNLNSHRAITQTVTWAILGSIDVNSAAFDAIDDWKLDKDAVRDVMTNYSGYDIANNKIVDLVYMLCEDHHDPKSCQPQLVPVYSSTHGVEVAFRNISTLTGNTDPIEDAPTGSLTITKNWVHKINSREQVINDTYVAKFDVTGPDGTFEVTISGNGSETVNDLALGTYTVTERAISGFIANTREIEVTFDEVNITGLAQFTNTRTETTSSGRSPTPTPEPTPSAPEPTPSTPETPETPTDPNTPNADVDDITDEDPPLTDSPGGAGGDKLSISDTDVPQSKMPKTGIEDTLELWISALCLSLLGVVFLIREIKKANKAKRKAI